ncbi:MAG: DUF6305 family protein [Syntrophorhabdaceae bacterium]|nr:DUF6305 family protein [Syntrophorhabdaceae bacterium]
MARKLFGFMGIAILAVFLVFPATVLAADLPAGVSAELPVAVTCPGQAPDGQIVKLLMGRAKIPVKYDPFMEPKDIAGNKTLILILGGSGKGLGSAGVDLREEIKRAENLIAEAQKQNIKLIGVHSGGADRRGGVSSMLIDLVAPKMQYLIVREDGNKDSFFSKLSAQHKIPLTLIQQNQDMGDIFKALFDK